MMMMRINVDDDNDQGKSLMDASFVVARRCVDIWMCDEVENRMITSVCPVGATKGPFVP
jgi:hypothetical protein